MNQINPNTIYCGDCVEVLSRFDDESVDLIYIDPPFFSGRHYAVIWKDNAEIRAFEDRWKGGSKGIHNYIEWMEPVIVQCHRVLKSTGSMYLHCDWHANAHLRLLMDRIFGLKNFQNEVIWFYKGGGASRKRFGRKHDTILFYSKSDKWTFNLDDVLKPLTEAQRNRYTLKDEGGYYGMHHGRKYYLPKGKIPEDVWQIPLIVPTSIERLGYPTQKPEALLEQIIKASSNPGDIVLDPMCGCGTAIAVAQKLKRQWVGVDISPTACKLMVRRMQKLGVQIKIEDIVGMPTTLEEIQAMKPFEFQNWVCEKLGGRVNPKKVADKGIDGRMNDGTPIEVKQHEVSRPDFDKFAWSLTRDKKSMGIMVGYRFGKGVERERARAKLEDGLEIEFVTAQKLLNGKFDGDKYHPLKKHQIPKEEDE